MKRSGDSELKKAIKNDSGIWAEKRTMKRVRISESMVLFIVHRYLKRNWKEKFESYDDGRFDDEGEGIIFEKESVHEVNVN